MTKSSQLISVLVLVAFLGSHSQMAPGWWEELMDENYESHKTEPSKPSRNTTWCMLLAWLWPMCYGFVLMSSAAAGAGEATYTQNTYIPGGSWRYDILTTLLLNDPGAVGKDVGFQISAEVKVDSVWKNPVQALDRLLKLELISPQLYIKSRKAPAPEGFIEHSSPLEELSNSPFLVHWRQGRVQSIYIPIKESVSIANLKKGIASLFQFQLLDGGSNETDASGQCSIYYTSTGPASFKKIKTACQIAEDTPCLVHPEQLFSVNVKSNREADYELASNNAYIKRIKSEESHIMTVVMRPDAGNKVKITQELKYTQSSTVTPIIHENIEEVIQQITNEVGYQFTHETLTTEKETKMCQDSTCPAFAKLVSDNLKNVDAKHYGTLKATTSFIKILNSARAATKDEIVKVLKKKQNKHILPAIYDVLGSAQTLESHEAAMKILRLSDENHLDNAERYLWSLSMGSHPRLDVIKDLLHRYLRTPNLGEKIQETLILTLASMTDKYMRTPNKKGKQKIYQSIKEAIYNGIENCDKKQCQYTYIRALKNLKSEDTIPKLTELVLHGSDKSGVFAMKALRSYSPTTWSADVIITAKKVFFQLKKKQDSSARTLALDILMESNPDEKLMNDLLLYLVSNDKAFEVKKYVMQKLLMLSDKKPEFKEKLRNIIRKDIRLHNYSVHSQKGMSTALSRQFLNHDVINGSMVSAQEMSSGLVKRGVFDIVLENYDKYFEMFSLGLYSGGLSSFISSDDGEEISDDDVATAGMELTMLGTQIRPFVFFSGQGELMGHVWSGTASESTTAFQINTLLHDHLQYLRLGPGFIAELSLQTGISFNLAGEIQISLWNRNSHSLVNQNAAIIMMGLLRVDTSFVQSKIEFTMSSEPKLDLESDIEFGSGVAVCLRLTQPSTVFKHNIFKIERIPGSKHKLRKAKYKVIDVPGRTYNLNRKNNEMCNILMQDR